MRTNEVSTRSRGRNLEECGCRRCNGTEAPGRGPHICLHQAKMGHPANWRSYLDLKRTKTDAPGWRCAAVCCSVRCLPNYGGVGRNLIKKPAARGLQQSPMEAAWNVKIRPPCCGCQAANATYSILRCITGICRVNSAASSWPTSTVQSTSQWPRKNPHGHPRCSDCRTGEGQAQCPMLVQACELLWIGRKRGRKPYHRKCRL